jgi:predicted DNA-binding protein
MRDLNKTIVVRISQEQLEKINSLVGVIGESKGEVIRAFINSYKIKKAK